MGNLKDCVKLFLCDLCKRLCPIKSIGSKLFGRYSCKCPYSAGWNHIGGNFEDVENL